MNRKITVGVLVASFAMASCLSADVILAAASTDLAAQGDTSPGLFSESQSNTTSPGSVELAFYDGGAEALFGLPNSLGLPNPFAVAHATAGTHEVVSAHGNVYYYFEVVGTGTGTVPLDIQYTVSASSDVVISGGGGASGDASVWVYNGNLGTPTQIGVDAHCNVADCNQVISGVLHLNAFPNFMYLLQVHAAAGSNAANANGFGEADPYLYVDPGFVNAADFRLVLSPGVGNSPPGESSGVPEPASLLLLGTGLAAVAARRRLLRT